jgi:hypothetical protein
VFSSSTSRWAAGTAAVSIGLVAVTYVGLVNPRRGEAADLTASAIATQSRNDTLEIQVAQLKAQFAKLPEKQADLATVLAQLPVAADVPTFVRSLDGLASQAGVSLDTVTPAKAGFLDGNGYPATTVTATGTGSGGAGAQIVAVPLTIAVHGPYFKTVTFLKSLQSGQRAFLVTGLQVTVAESDVTLTVRGRVFALPGVATALAALKPSGGAASSAGATPAPAPAPSASQAPTPSASASASPTPSASTSQAPTPSASAGLSR